MGDSAIPTLAVPAPLYDEALAFCNARLAERGKPPIETLPAGVPRNAYECPCGKACGGKEIAVRLYDWERRHFHRGGEFDYAETIRDGHPTGFVTYFDSHIIGERPVLPVRDASLPVQS